MLAERVLHIWLGAGVMVIGLAIVAYLRWRAR